MLDQTTLLIAIGLGAAGLMATLLVAWLGARRDAYLLSWGSGLALIVASVVTYGLFSEPYVPLLQFLTFSFLVGGFALTLVGAVQFRLAHVPRKGLHGLAAAGAIASMGLAFGLGYSGVGTMLCNLWCAVYFGLAGYQFWRGRAEAPLAMWTQALLYAATALSFLLCALVLLVEGRYVLTARPANWAEDLNSLVIVVALAGIGALALAVSQLRATKAERRRALTDPLTGLLNRRALFAAVPEGPLADGTAVLMLDLDRFKAINDSFGHARGDQVLVGFAALLRQFTGPGDLVARLGGEEFCVLLDVLASAEAERLAERIRAALANGEPLSPGFGSPTVSIGLAVASGGEDSFDSLLRRADRALYAAKDGGRNTVRSASRRAA